MVIFIGLGNLQFFVLKKKLAHSCYTSSSSCLGVAYSYHMTSLTVCSSQLA